MISNLILSRKPGLHLPKGSFFPCFICPRICFLLLLLISFAHKTTLHAQTTSCTAISDCSTSLRLEVVRETVNTSSTCATNDLCGTGNNFYQIKYRVFLRYSSNTPPSQQQPFNLQYKSLKAVVRLEVLGSTSNQFSHIDVSATQSCYAAGPGANWSAQTVGFNVDASIQTVEIDFMNTSTTNACGTGSDAINFTWGTPTGLTMGSCTPSTYCAYAELFPIIVNAYPGETIRVKPQVSEFVPFDSDVHQTCNPISVVNSGNSNGGTSINVTSPMSHANTANANLIAEVLTPVLSNGKQKFEVRVRNTGTTTLKIRYLEFVVQGAFNFPDVILSFSGNNTPVKVKPSTNDRNIHYIVASSAGFNIGGSASYSIGFVEVSPPNPTNQSWCATLSLIESTKSRVRSIPAGSSSSVCTTLPLSTTTQQYCNTGSPVCTAAPLFKVQPKGGSFDPCGSNPPMIQVGFDQVDQSSEYKLSRFIFEIEFELTGGLAISDVNFDDWVSNWTCPTPNFNNCLPANPTAPCYNISGSNVVSFCYVDVGGNHITLTGDRYINIVFNNTPGCITRVIVRMLEISPYGQGTCIPVIENTLMTPSATVCPPQVKGQITTELNEGVDEVDVTLTTDTDPLTCSQPGFCNTAPCSAQPGLTNINGNYGFCTCVACNCFIITPAKDDNPLNGVTTYDLVLISKHILGTEPLNSPYKMIAADANNSRSITTFDIVELRKLILGIYDELPNNTSWRFVPKSFTFPNLANAFQTSFPEIEEEIAANGVKPVDFWGIKVGDVNNTAVPNRPSQRPIEPLTWIIPTATAAGSIITVPVIYSGIEPLEAFQLGLRYDTSRLQLLSPSQGDLPYFDAGSVYLPRPGEIRTLWLPMDAENPDLHIEPGAVLFHLTFRVISQVPSFSLLQLDDRVLQNAVWRTGGIECAVQGASGVSKRSEESVAPLHAVIRPNPASGEASLHLDSPKPGRARIVFFDAYGRRLALRDVTLTEGAQEIAMPETATLPVGVYLWKLYAGGLKEQGHFIKQ